MTDSPTGLLDRLGPLGFLVLFVVLAAIFAVVNNPPAGENATTGAPPAGTTGVAVEESGTYPETVAELETASVPSEPASGASSVTGSGKAVTAVETSSVAAVSQAQADADDDGEATRAAATPSKPARPIAPSSGTASNRNTGATNTTAATDDGSDTPPAETAATPSEDATVAADASPAPAVEASAVPVADGWVVGDTARQLAATARALNDAQSLFEPGSAVIADAARTGLVELVDAMARDPALAIGIAARLDEKLGVTGFPQAERRALALRGYFVNHGIDPGRIVAGVLAPDYQPADGANRSIEFFFAERAE